MKKFEALLFREMRISRKKNILSAVVMTLLGVFYIVGVYGIKHDAETTHEMVISMITALSGSMGMLSVLFGTAHNDTLKSDINTNWLTYSYALPIQSKDRAAVTVTAGCLSTLLMMVEGLVFTAVYCVIGEVRFTAAFFVMYVIMFAGASLFGIVTDSIVLRSKSIEELNRSVQRIGLGLLGVCIIIGIIFSDKLKYYFNSDAGLPVYKLLEKLNGKMLMWLIPLCAVLVYADYLAVKSSMRSVYSAAKNRTETKPQEKETISDTHEYPTGFLYKEIRQNRFMIISVAVLPLVTLAMTYLIFAGMVAVGDKPNFSAVLSDSENNLIRYLFIVTGAYVASGFMSNIFTGDDRKLWAYFTASTPGGVRTSLYYKYVIAFAMDGIFMVSSIFAASIYDTVYFAATGKENDVLTTLFLFMFLILLAVCALDIPFIIRFGQKKGSYIKTALMLGISTVLVLIYDNLTDTAKKTIMEFFTFLRDGRANDIVALVISFVSALCLTAYVLSYKFSCKLFMKGVDGYDK